MTQANPTFPRTAAEALGRIADDQRDLQAWVFVDADASAMTPAAGPLHGMPFGVKDIIDVAGLPTRFGLAHGKETVELDAWCVAALRAAGGIPIGKTHTTPLAFRDPAPTRNPHHPDRTPGGSSAGSAAAVAAGHIPFALGTQTIGSVLRPASFCGIVGYKPTYGTIPMQGVSPLAPSLDHVGVLAIDVEVAIAFAEVFLPGLDVRPRAPHIAFAPATFAPRFEPEVLTMLEALAGHLGRAGANVERVALPDCVDDSIAPLHTIVAYEAHAALAPLRRYGPLPPGVAGLIASGAETARGDYDGARAFRISSAAEIDAVLRTYDVVLTGGANSAPARESTGDPTPLAPWTFWGTPAVTLPVGRAGNGLPLGVQLVAAHGADGTLLGAARWVATALRGFRL